MKTDFFRREKRRSCQIILSCNKNFLSDNPLRLYAWNYRLNRTILFFSPHELRTELKIKYIHPRFLQRKWRSLSLFFVFDDVPSVQNPTPHLKLRKQNVLIRNFHFHSAAACPARSMTCASKIRRIGSGVPFPPTPNGRRSRFLERRRQLFEHPLIERNIVARKRISLNKLKRRVVVFFYREQVCCLYCIKLHLLVAVFKMNSAVPFAGFFLKSERRSDFGFSPAGAKKSVPANEVRERFF